MLLTRETQTTFGRLHPAEVCVEFPLLLLDEHLAELEHRASSAQRTIGQMIRQAIGLYLAGACERCGTDGTWGDSQLDVPFGLRTLAVTLLLPMSRLAELEALAARRATTTSALIRHIVCCSILGRSPSQKLPNES